MCSCIPLFLMLPNTLTLPADQLADARVHVAVSQRAAGFCRQGDESALCQQLAFATSSPEQVGGPDATQSWQPLSAR
jgi:hypothetical protein